MRKSVFLTLLIALFSVATAWAEFNPTPGVKYALQEKTSGLYLDILTLGITDPGFNTNNISLSSAPCAIYFEAHDEWTWYMKNIKGQYVNTENYAWNPEIGDTKKIGLLLKSIIMLRFTLGTTLTLSEIQKPVNLFIVTTKTLPCSSPLLNL